MCSTSSLVQTCVVIGALLVAASLAGLGCTLYLIFGDPMEYSARNTYQPSWEDVGPALASCVLSLLFNVLLIGGSRQFSRSLLLLWIGWQVCLVLVFWSWFGYNHLKHQGYVDGLKGCYFCGLHPQEMAVSFGGILGTVLILFALIPVIMLRSRCSRLELRQGGSRQQLAGSPAQLYQELTDRPHLEPSSTNWQPAMSQQQFLPVWPTYPDSHQAASHVSMQLPLIGPAIWNAQPGPPFSGMQMRPQVQPPFGPVYHTPGY